MKIKCQAGDGDIHRWRHIAELLSSITAAMKSKMACFVCTSFQEIRNSIGLTAPLPVEFVSFIGLHSLLQVEEHALVAQRGAKRRSLDDY